MWLAEFTNQVECRTKTNRTNIPQITSDQAIYQPPIAYPIPIIIKPSTKCIGIVARINHTINRSFAKSGAHFIPYFMDEWPYTERPSHNIWLHRVPSRGECGSPS